MVNLLDGISGGLGLEGLIILWNYVALTKIIMRSDISARKTLVNNITRASILTWQHVNMHGIYDFSNLTAENDNEFGEC